MLGIYLSGTGNTKHCIEKLIQLLDETAQAVSVEKQDAVNALSRHDFIVLAYPVQFSNAPVMIRDFIRQHSALWKGKKVLCVATMGLFSGDGAGCSARLLKKCGAKKIKQGKYPKDGLYFYDRIAGFICQRFWCYGKTKDYLDKLKINHNCTGCGLCVRLCPMENLIIKHNEAIAKSRCTMCCPCISSCPQQAISLLENTVVEQCRYGRYVKE